MGFLTFLLLLGSSTASIAVGELAARRLDLSRTWRAYIGSIQPGQESLSLWTKEVVGFRRVGGLRIEGKGPAFITNDDGFRDRPFRDLAASGKLRIAFLGDSVTEGFAAAAADRFSDLVGARSGFVSMNFAVTGHSTADEFVVLQTHVLRYQPTVVFVQICSNDLERNDKKLRILDGEPLSKAILLGSTRKEPTGPELKHFLRQNSALYLALAERYNTLKLRAGGTNDILDSVTSLGTRDWTSTFVLLGRMAELVRRAGAALVVSYLPLDVEVQAGGDSAGYHMTRLFLDWCTTNPSITCLDVTGPMRRERKRGLHFDDCHLSVAGHQVVAEQIVGLLERDFRSRARTN